LSISKKLTKRRALRDDDDIERENWVKKFLFLKIEMERERKTRSRRRWKIYAEDATIFKSK